MKALDPRYVSRFTTESYDRMEIQRDGQLDEDDRTWNKCHGPRNYHVLDAILDHARTYDLRDLSVLNMSGMNEGKPDPILFDLLCQNFDRARISWSVVDHPQSLTFTDPHIRRWTQERGIACIAHDHRAGVGPISAPPADIVLCTEIVEHLDYSDTVALLRACRAALKPGGLLVVTTPNAVYLGYRVLFALGRWDFLHFNDGPEHVEKGLVGHTIYYDGKRLSRLLTALDYSRVRASTFNAGHGPGEYRTLARRAAAMTLRTLSGVVANSGQVLRVLAQRPF
jgi:SAM-dependent methyltransferase